MRNLFYEQLEEECSIPSKSELEAKVKDLEERLLYMRARLKEQDALLKRQHELIEMQDAIIHSDLKLVLASAYGKTVS